MCCQRSSHPADFPVVVVSLTSTGRIGYPARLIQDLEPEQVCCTPDTSMFTVRAFKHVLPAEFSPCRLSAGCCFPDSECHAFEAQDGQDGKADFVAPCKISMSDELKIDQ